MEKEMRFFYDDSAASRLLLGYLLSKEYGNTSSSFDAISTTTVHNVNYIDITLKIQ